MSNDQQHHAANGNIFQQAGNGIGERFWGSIDGDPGGGFGQTLLFHSRKQGRNEMEK